MDVGRVYRTGTIFPTMFSHSTKRPEKGQRRGQAQLRSQENSLKKMSRGLDHSSAQDQEWRMGSWRMGSGLSFCLVFGKRKDLTPCLVFGKRKDLTPCLERKDLTPCLLTPCLCLALLCPLKKKSSSRGFIIRNCYWARNRHICFR